MIALNLFLQDLDGPQRILRDRVVPRSLVLSCRHDRREFQASIDPHTVAAPLVLHPRHPRSIRFNLAELQAALRAISGSAPGGCATREHIARTYVYDAVVRG